ncbi:MAG: pentapeptide repeat-containing protein [Saprospiraceae bacterium]
MKKTKHLLIGFIFGTAIGWALGFLRIPYLEKNSSFLLGFTTALAFVSLVLILLAAWNRGFLAGFIGKKTEVQGPKNTPAHTVVWILLLGVLVLGGALGGLRIYREMEFSKLQVQNQDRQLRELESLIAQRKNNNLEPLMRIILEDIGEELNHHPGRRLRDTTIARIAALNLAFEPYHFVDGDSLSNLAYSPERGQLLQALVLMNIDSGSFAKIKGHVLFAQADLRGARLKGADLSGINLKKAILKDADLSGANLKGADLGEANFWGANLNRANLSQTDLKRADFSWALLNESSLAGANLNGATLSNAQLRKADLVDANFQWGQTVGAMFNEANLASINLRGTNLSKANLSQANLCYTDLRNIDLSEANLLGAQFGKAMVEEKWPEKLNQWNPVGLKEMNETFSVVNDSSDTFKVPLFRLNKN